MRLPSVLVFDIDDTLYLERDFVRSGFAAVGRWIHRTLGVGGFDEICWSLFEAGTRGEIFNQALARVGCDADASFVERLVEVYRTHTPAIHLLPDAEAILESLPHSMATAAISDGPLAAQRRKSSALGLEHRLGAVFLTDQWGREYWKPHPRAFLNVQETFRVVGEQCVYIADNPYKDFHAPRRLGWRTIRIRRPGGLHATTPNDPLAEPDYEVESLDEILAVSS